MNAFDFSPLHRTGVGFDRLMSVLENAGRLDDAAAPAYDIVRTEPDRYRITLLVPGYDRDQISIESQENSLVVSATVVDAPEQVTYLHRGITQRGFKRSFQLADYVRVTDARLENGLLHIELLREVPERLKPRRIPISSAERVLDADVVDAESSRSAA
ncbi:MAG: Hsp20 family protein [Gammaproteobacteria bacterium]|nr:Hsp20 family protein [Gammaproteobacteria bacterium]